MDRKEEESKGRALTSWGGMILFFDHQLHMRHCERKV
jgi:hypothetical protein